MSKQTDKTNRVSIAIVPTIEIPLFARSDNPHMVRMDLTMVTAETARALMYHGLRQKIADAAAAPAGTPRDERIALAEKVARSIETNTLGSRVETWTEMQLMGISMFVAKKYAGKVPKGGKAGVWAEIEDLPAEKRERFDAAVQAAMGEGDDW